MGVQELVHRMIHGLGLHGLIDRHHNRIVVRRGKSHCLTKLVILIETGLTSKDDSGSLDGRESRPQDVPRRNSFERAFF